MKAIKMSGLAALTALMAMAFGGTSSAMAETTALCKADESPCAAANRVGSTHLVGTSLVSSSIGHLTCDILFTGTVQTDELGNPLSKTGTTVWTNCTLGSTNCTVSEENGPAKYTLLKEGHETASVTFAFLMHVVCSGFINCSYNGVGLKATAKGPLLASVSNPNGEISLSEQALSKEAGGFLCPKTSKLTFTTTSLSATYISS